MKKYVDLLEKVNCNLCGVDDYSIVYSPQYEKINPENLEESFRSSADEILVDQLVKCRRCGLEYLNPRLDQKLIINAYSRGSDETFISQARSREKTFERSLRYIEGMYPKKGRILDVGTAGGSFLSVARKRGWEVYGCEPNRWLTQWCEKNYQIQIHAGTIFDMELEDASFDVITLWDVLEHTVDPKSVLLKCDRLLKPKGLLVVNYPDIGAWISRLMGRKWVFLLSVHLYYFTFSTIRRMLESSGFEVLKSKKHWQTLQLDYILFRMKAYIPFFPEMLRKLFGLIGMKNLEVPYWIGQTLVIARRNN